MKKLLLPFLIFLLTPYGAIGIDLYTPSLPAIANSLNIDTTLVMLTITTYLFGLGVGQLFTGTLSDMYGRRPVLLWGMGIFFVTSIAIILINNILAILILRTIQGLGAGASSSISKSLVTDNYKGYELVKISSTRTIIWGLGPILAPVIGGYLQYYYGWHASFYFFAITSLLLLLIVYFFLEETNTYKIGLDWHLILRNYLTILSHKKFLAALFLLSMGYSLIVTFHVLGPFLIQSELGYNSIVYGHIALLNGIAYFLGALINRFLIKFVSLDRIIGWGLALMLISSTMGLLSTHWICLNIFTLSIPVFLVIFSLGFVFPNCSAKCLSLFPQMAGTAAAIIGSFYVILTAVISYIATFFESDCQRYFFMLYCLLTLIGMTIYWRLIKEKS